jgi:hypothetical protein
MAPVFLPEICTTKLQNEQQAVPQIKPRSGDHGGGYQNLLLTNPNANRAVMTMVVHRLFRSKMSPFVGAASRARNAIIATNPRETATQRIVSRPGIFEGILAPPATPIRMKQPGTPTRNSTAGPKFAPTSSRMMATSESMTGMARLWHLLCSPTRSLSEWVLLTRSGPCTRKPNVDVRAIFHPLFISASSAAFIDLHISKT